MKIKFKILPTEHVIKKFWHNKLFQSKFNLLSAIIPKTKNHYPKKNYNQDIPYVGMNWRSKTKVDVPNVAL